MTIVASGDYVARRGTPNHPQDILDHDAICFAFGSGENLAPWGFDGPEGAYTLRPKPRMVANDMRTLLAYAKHGLGLAYLYREIALPQLREGGLTEVLSGHVGQLPRYSLNYRSKRNMTRRLRAFVDMAKASRKPS